MPLTVGSSTADQPRAAFYFDLASPEAYLAAERVLQVLPVAAEWVPVRAHALAGRPGPPEPGEQLRQRVETRARELGLQPVRWPPPATDPELALLAATYARSIGRAVAFAQAAFRQAFAGARDLSVADNVVIAAAACEMHPTALLKAVQTRGVRAALDRATQTAVQRGVLAVPGVWLPGGAVLHGERELDAVGAA